LSEDYLTQLFNLPNKVAVIIGGGGHLCSTMAVSLAKAGVRVAVLDKEIKKAEAVAEQINLFSSDALPLSIDVTNKEDHEKCRDKIIETFGSIDILINGAGINAPTPFFDITVEQWQAILDSHIIGTMLGCQVFGAYMVEKENGSIINISSASAGPPLSKAFAYSVAKAGIKNLTQNLAREWATKHVRVNALRPGFFPTAWSMKNFIDDERKQSILSHTPMERFGKPEELIGAVLWLASDVSVFVTGSEVTVDGGFSCMTV
jgi:NAD(P)-dependent dehydrogenase (short-subunit alcohol dehydrogenase family)